MSVGPNQLVGGLVLGFGMPWAGATGTNILLNAANTWLAYSFVAPQASTTLSAVRLWCVAKSGTVVAGDASCTLYSDSAAGIPNAAIEAKTATGAPAATTMVNWTGFTTALTAGTRYWLVFKNLNATPASNNFNWFQGSAQSLGSGVLSGIQTATVGWGWMKLQTADAGSTWASAVVHCAGPRIAFADGTFDGQAVQTIGTETAANAIYAKREIGNLLTVPANLKANIRRVAFLCFKAGSPTGNLQFRIYRSGTLLGTSNAIPLGNVSTVVAWYEAAFTSSIVISGGDVIRVVMSETTQSDTNTNRYTFNFFTIDNDADSKALKPFDGTLTYTVTGDSTAGPVVWVDTDTQYIPMALTLDTSGEFGAQASGGLVRANMSGGVL